MEKTFKCVCGKNVKVLKSAAGWYIGTVDEDGFPYCRISGYYNEERRAQMALDGRYFCEREASENLACHGGWGSCMPEAYWEHDDEQEDE